MRRRADVTGGRSLASALPVLPSSALLIFFLAGCAGPVTVPMSAPHGVVEPQQHQGGDATYPVVVVAIDGTNLDGTRTHFPLTPGRHEVVVSPKCTDGAFGDSRTSPLLDHACIHEVTDLRSARHSRIPRRQAIVLDVAEGWRYVIAAHATGPTADDWQPVLTKMENLNP